LDGLFRYKTEVLMKQYDVNSLVIHPNPDHSSEVLVEVSPEQAGWDTIHFQSRRLSVGCLWISRTEQNESAIILLSGCIAVSSNCGNWPSIGSRQNVFTGLPSALYLPNDTDYVITARMDSEFAVASVAAKTTHPARWIKSKEITTEIRGGDHATRQINQIIPPGFPCSRLVVVEVYTPGGNWSSYPPHKHDLQKTTPDGAILEADLDEIYYYKIDRPEGYALQRIYTDPESPLQKDGRGFDFTVLAHNNDVVLVPEGYHPVSVPPGYTGYYLNVLAGSAQSLAASDDPAFTWVKTSYTERDKRVPLYPVNSIK
jgi:5-deoxy-glucuronate isomerase